MADSVDKVIFGRRSKDLRTVSNRFQNLLGGTVVFVEWWTGQKFFHSGGC
jgi:hypothetical protein